MYAETCQHFSIVELCKNSPFGGEWELEYSEEYLSQLYLTNMHDNPAITGSAKASKITLGLESVEYELLLYLMEKCPTDRTLYHILTIKWARFNFGTSERKLYPWWPLLCHILGPMDFLCCWKTSFHILVVILTDIAIFHGFPYRTNWFKNDLEWPSNWLHGNQFEIIDWNHFQI